MIGIIILNYTDWDGSIKCINSIRENIGEILYHIYLVDNASPVKPTNEFLECINMSDVTFFANDENTGYAAGNNIGVKMAMIDNCQYILICNSDILFFPKSIQLMKNYLDGHNNVGIVGPKIYNLDGSVHVPDNRNKIELREIYLDKTKLRSIYRKFSSKYLTTNIDVEKTCYVFAVMGCCFMMSKYCAERITPFDENTFLYYEEAIIGVNMLKNNFKTVYYPGSAIIHAHGNSTEKVKAFSEICWVQSELYYCKKHLKVNSFLLILLYVIRCIEYFARCFKYQDYRNNVSFFLKETLFRLF